MGSNPTEPAIRTDPLRNDPAKPVLDPKTSFKINAKIRIREDSHLISLCSVEAYQTRFESKRITQF